MRSRTALTVLAACGALVAGCGSSPVTQQGAQAGSSSSADAYAKYRDFTGSDREQKLLDAVKQDGNVLDIYTSNTDEEDSAAAFMKKYPKITVNVFRANSETVLQRELQEAAAGKGANDIVDTNDAELNTMSDKGLLAPYHGPGLDGLRPGSEFKNWTASRFNAFVVGWNTDHVKKGEEPKTFADLADPKWKGRLAMEVGDWDWYAALHTYFTTKKGMSDADADALFKKLVANAKVVKGHTVMGELLSAGQFDVALSIYSHTVDKAAAKGAPVAWRPAVAPVIVRPNGLALMAHPRHAAAALLWMDWQLTDGQKPIAEAHRVTARANVPGFTDPIPADAETFDMPQDEVTQHGKEWAAKYDDAVRNAPKAG
jgi:iron(III) transport system substrate-binding protein